MKIQFAIGLLSIFSCTYVQACFINTLQQPHFELTGTLGSFNSHINNQVINVTPNPTRYTTLMLGCSVVSEGKSTFQISSIANLNTAATINFNGRTYFRITSPQAPVTANPAEVYLAFSVRDNNDSATLFPILGPEEYDFFNKTSTSTRGMRLEQLSILIRGTNLTPGTYTINDVFLGTVTASSSLGTASQNVKLSNLSYTITASTCTVNSPTITLPTMRISDFSSTNTAVGSTTFTMTATCANDATNTHYSATITDNATSAANANGILQNTITATSGGSNVKIKLMDNANTPIPIGPFALQNTFDFGLLNSSKTATKTFKAAYVAETLPATAGLVKSTSVLNLIYD